MIFRCMKGRRGCPLEFPPPHATLVAFFSWFMSLAYIMSAAAVAADWQSSPEAAARMSRRLEAKPRFSTKMAGKHEMRARNKRQNAPSGAEPALEQYVATRGGTPLAPALAEWWFDLVWARGDVTSLQRLLERRACADDDTLSVGFLGGSNMVGAGASSKRTRYTELICRSLLAMMQPGRSLLKYEFNQQGGTFADSSRGTRFPPLDLLVLDLAVNSWDQVQLEDTLRSLQPQGTAVIAVHWLRHAETERKFVDAHWDGSGLAETWYHTANFELALAPVLSYYGVPQLSLKTALHPLARVLPRPAGRAQHLWADDLVHPSDLGHKLIATVVLQALSTAARAGRGGRDGTSEPSRCAQVMRAAWFGARARNGTSGSSSSTPSSNPWRQLYAGYRSFQLERGAGTTGVLHPDAGVLQWYAPLALGPATLLSLATADSHSWRISSNETSRAGLRRPVALLSHAVGATLEVRAQLRGLLGVRLVQSYANFGKLNVSWECEPPSSLAGTFAPPSSSAGSRADGRDPTRRGREVHRHRQAGHKLLSGWHADRTSLARAERVVTSSGSCLIRFVNVADTAEPSRTSFKLLQVNVAAQG